jgi:predicted nucleotidyltransferase
VEPVPQPAFLHRTVERLVRAFAPERIVLFGSYAKGAARPGSDIDLLIVADLAGDPTAHLRRARQLVADAFPPVDIVLCTPEEVAEAPNARSPFLLSVLGSGSTLYSRVNTRPPPPAARDKAKP